jgi:hypothetical protein
MTDFLVDLNEFSGGPHWLSPLGKLDRTTIRAKHRAAWLAQQKPTPAHAETMAKLNALHARLKAKAPTPPPSVERQVIDGRPATIAYFDAAWKPVDKNTSGHYAKVLFDDGEMLILQAPGTPEPPEGYAPHISDPDDPDDMLPMTEDESRAAARSLAEAFPELVDRSIDRKPEATPADAKDHLLSWSKAIMILDASEVLVRDIVERELNGVAGLDHVTIGVVETVTKRLMARVRAVRTEAIQLAFRALRSRIGDEEIRGHSLATWAQYFLQFDLTNIETAIRTGLIQGLDNMAIARKVVGSMGLSGIDGVTEYTRHRIAHLGKQQVKSLGLEERD